MSDPRDLTLPKLLKALKNVGNWFWFGTMLNVPHSELSKIESKHQKDPDRCKIDMLQYWLDNESEPTWSYVVHALEDANHRALAAQIRREFIEERVTETGVERHSAGAIASSISLTTIQQTGVEQEQSTATSVEILESDQVDLRARLQCCEQDLKTALTMKETTIVASHAYVEERISHLKMESRKEIDDLKRKSEDEIKQLKSLLKKNEETVADVCKKNDLAQADMMAAGHRRDSDIEETKMKVEKLMRDSEDSKSNCQPQSSMDSTHQLNDKVDTLEAAQRKNSKDSVNRHKKSRQTELDPETAPSVSQFQAKQTAVGHPKLEILVCGTVGVGKSSLINSLLGVNVCRVGDLAVGDLGVYTRSTVQFRLTLSDGIEVSIYDSPGLYDGRENRMYLEEMYSKCKNVDVVLYCVDMTTPRFTPGDQHAIGLITKKFGPTIWKRCVLVLTKANCVYVPQARRETSSALIEYHKELFRNIQEKFCSYLENHGVSARVCEGLRVVAAGYSDYNDHNRDERMVVYASEHSMADPRPPLQRVDFITELWAACLETVPEASRIHYLQAIALGGRIKENDGEPAGYLRRIAGSIPKTDDNTDRTCRLL